MYPEAASGSCYYFAEKAFLDRENREHHKWARLAKIITGYSLAAHLFYWVYPGIMVAFMATLIGYLSAPNSLAKQFGNQINLVYFFRISRLTAMRVGDYRHDSIII